MADFLSQIDRSWTLFLDRDGVINQRIIGGYVDSIDDFVFLLGVLESIRVFNQKFGRIVIVTNQQGVGKGLMTPQQLAVVHAFMLAEIKRARGHVDGVYFCTDLASDPNNCRKPSTIMAENARLDFPEIDFSKSVMVGDSNSDIQFGKNCGMKTVYIQSKNVKQNLNSDLTLNGLPELIDLIK